MTESSSDPFGQLFGDPESDPLLQDDPLTESDDPRENDRDRQDASETSSVSEESTPDSSSTSPTHSHESESDAGRTRTLSIPRADAREGHLDELNDLVDSGWRVQQIRVDAPSPSEKASSTRRSPPTHRSPTKELHIHLRLPSSSGLFDLL